MSQAAADLFDQMLDDSGFNKMCETAERIIERHRVQVAARQDWWSEVEDMTEQAHAIRARCLAKLGGKK